MPVHDWSRIDAGIFHDFHHAWIEEIKRSLNSGLLPDDFYAMAEQQTGPYGPDVLTLQAGASQRLPESSNVAAEAAVMSPQGNVLLAPPAIALTAQADMQFYRRKQNLVVVRHVSGDEIVAVVEIVSRGNKSSLLAIRALIEKAAELLFQGIHLLLLDLHPPGLRDPDGIHAALWNEMTSQVCPKPDKPLTLAAYEASSMGATRAYVQPVEVGDLLPDMPLFLRPGAHIAMPLESTYSRAFEAIPKRWRRVIDTTGTAGNLPDASDSTV